MPELELGDQLLFVMPIVLSATTLLALHWFPWNKGTKPLKRTTAYVVGTLVLEGYPIAAMFMARAMGMIHDETFWALLLIANMVVSGAAVHIAYWIDDARAVTPEDAHADRDL